MFKKLRNKLILINLGITTLVIVVAFSFIYLFSTNSAKNRPPMPMDNNNMSLNKETASYMEDIIHKEKKAAAEQLLITLVISGIAIEIIVAFISYLLAEQAIGPIRDSYNSQKMFIANASHEIKTPLASISANLEAADIHGNKWIKNIETETEKLTKLNNELLMLARADATPSPVKTETNLRDLINDSVSCFEARIKNKKLVSDVQNISIRIVAADLLQIINILLDNAIKYSDSEIKVSADTHKIIVKNDGKKIEKDSLSHLFDRFYQVDKTSEGVGLGLSIAKAIADKNGWRITAESDSKYTTFCLFFA